MQGEGIMPTCPCVTLKKKNESDLMRLKSFFDRALKGRVASLLNTRLTTNTWSIKRKQQLLFPQED